ncbi:MULTISPECIES: hypothetical protein [Bacillus]|uniref:Uncharacterized protein n=1 Tax=Bacillus glycinifermentans TaxID=1664069 RepID=A0A0T6BNI6_9BACI|nr:MULTISPECIES: hypothetical protein [Bacillus]KRT93084.1 hypothetical protein AB447_203890 [Bacillus glycinifermentans]MEC0341935.1 hypothetical protein [Bacillus sonorensis]MEC0457379.1 hypothetical protein [Bacillus sonorensis]MEC0487895.1 hypothetical protein [Bacillus glycinifermentans]MEC0530654.1 hypothetical protein [Bacillus sonorensis]
MSDKKMKPQGFKMNIKENWKIISFFVAIAVLFVGSNIGVYFATKNYERSLDGTQHEVEGVSKEIAVAIEGTTTYSELQKAFERKRGSITDNLWEDQFNLKSEDVKSRYFQINDPLYVVNIKDVISRKTNNGFEVLVIGSGSNQNAGSKEAIEEYNKRMQPIMDNYCKEFSTNEELCNNAVESAGSYMNEFVYKAKFNEKGQMTSWEAIM